MYLCTRCRLDTYNPTPFSKCWLILSKQPGLPGEQFPLHKKIQALS